MVIETGSSVPVPVNVKQTFHSASTPIATPTVDSGYFTANLEADLYKENGNLHGALGKFYLK
jgi:hypothetical protein